MRWIHHLRAIEPYLISIDTNTVNKAATLNSNLIDYNPADFTDDINISDTTTPTLSISNKVNEQITDFIAGKTLEDLKKEINFLKVQLLSL